MAKEVYEDLPQRRPFSLKRGIAKLLFVTEVGAAAYAGVFAGAQSENFLPSVLPQAPQFKGQSVENNTFGNLFERHLAQADLIVLDGGLSLAGFKSKPLEHMVFENAGNLVASRRTSVRTEQTDDADQTSIPDTSNPDAHISKADRMALNKLVAEATPARRAIRSIRQRHHTFD